MTSPADTVGGIVLTGGTGARLDGADKAALELGGRTLLERALAALAAVPDVVVVGPEVRTTRPVGFRQEDPPAGGPAAGVLAGLDWFARAPDLVVVLAVDMPQVTDRTVARLLDAAAGDGAVLVDPGGRRQHLCAVYRASALEAARPASAHGLPMRRLVAGLDLATVAATGREADDVDTWADLSATRERLGG